MAKKKATRRPAKKTAAKGKARSAAPAKKKKAGGASSAEATGQKKKEPAKKAARERVSAEKMSEQHREISISEFFTKNRHLLGFDNASRALLTSVKEAVDNSLDACEEAGILPDIKVVLQQTQENRYRMTVEDNGPGIVKTSLPKVFGKLLYGSKFHRMRQSRGQQGIGISAAGMYGQLTTGQPVHVISKTGKGRKAYQLDIRIDTAGNKPVILNEAEADWDDKDHGTVVSIEMEASYKSGKRSIDEFLQDVAFSNPHLRLEYWPPNRKPIVYPRISEELPPETKEIKPHPYGVELGLMLRMAHVTKSPSMSGFLQSEFSRVSSSVAEEILGKAGVDPNLRPPDLRREGAEKLYKAIADTKIMSPPTNCLAPIGEAAMLEGLKGLLVQQHIQAEEAKLRRKAEADGKPLPEDAAEQAEAKVAEALEAVKRVEEEEEDEAGEIEAPKGSPEEAETIPKAGVIELFGHQAFLTAVTRSPKVYRGNPFQVEAALAYGGELPGDQLAQVYRFANRVPLLYQQGACAMTQAVVRTNWKSYDVEQSRGALPAGPLIVMVHIASVWVPFTSEAKEAVAHYDEIIGELKFALQECGRRLARHIRRKRRIADAEKKQKYIEKYIPHIGLAIQDILGINDKRRDELVDELTGILERSRKM